MDPLNLPTSLLNQEHLNWLKQAEAVHRNLQMHIDQAKRAGIPGMEQHQESLNTQAA